MRANGAGEKNAAVEDDDDNVAVAAAACAANEREEEAAGGQAKSRRTRGERLNSKTPPQQLTLDRHGSNGKVS